MSSMVQDAYDMGLTTSLGGMPKSSLYYDNDYDYTDDEEFEENFEEAEFPETNILKLNISKKRAVLHNDEKCVENTGNIMKFDTYDDYQQFLCDNLSDYEIFECPLCVENSYNDNKSIENHKNEIPSIDIDDDEIPF